MSNPEPHFKTKSEMLGWFEKEAPTWLADYEPAKKLVKESNFSGSAKLLKREVGEKVGGFLSFLTELNLAHLLVLKEVKDLCYEPKGIVGIDFSFDRILLSAKNLQMKDYEKSERDEIQQMILTGGGKRTLSHKNPSLSKTFIEVARNEMGTFTQSRTEIGHSGFLESDLYQMSPPMKYIGEFENLANVDGFKKVLFIMNYSEEFKPYHARDIGLWYFDSFAASYQPIFANDLSWYYKLLGAEKKLNNIDAIIFMFPPNPLIWLPNCFDDLITKDDRRLTIYTRDAGLKDELVGFLNRSSAMRP